MAKSAQAKGHVPFDAPYLGEVFPESVRRTEISYTLLAFLIRGSHSFRGACHVLFWIALALHTTQDEADGRHSTGVQMPVVHFSQMFGILLGLTNLLHSNLTQEFSILSRVLQMGW